MQQLSLPISQVNLILQNQVPAASVAFLEAWASSLHHLPLRDKELLLSVIILVYIVQEIALSTTVQVLVFTWIRLYLKFIATGKQKSNWFHL